MMRRLALAAALALAFVPAFATSSQAHENKLKDLTIEHPWARATAPTAKTGAVYVKITNNGKTEDRLIGVAVDRAERTELHSNKLEDGVMKMRPIEGGLALPAGQTVELKPGGNHIMLVNLKQPLNEGEEVPLKLTFEKSGTIQVDIIVQAPNARADGMGHEHMGNMNH